MPREFYHDFENGNRQKRTAYIAKNKYMIYICPNDLAYILMCFIKQLKQEEDN